MTEIAISMEEYKELLEVNIRFEMLKKMAKKDRYISRADIVGVLGIEEEEEA